MEAHKNTCIDFVFEDGDSVKVTLAFYALYRLKAKNKKIYDEYCKVMAVGFKEELDMAVVVYTAYLCAYIDSVENCMSYEDFLIKCGSDKWGIQRTAEALVRPKKR